MSDWDILEIHELVSRVEYQQEVPKRVEIQNTENQNLKSDEKIKYLVLYGWC